MINKKLFHSTVLASLLLAPTISASERKVIAEVKTELPELTTMISNDADRLLLQDFINENYEALSVETISKLEDIVGVPSDADVDFTVVG